MESRAVAWPAGRGKGEDSRCGAQARPMRPKTGGLAGVSEPSSIQGQECDSHLIGSLCGYTACVP